jgi:hypothetical protein
MKRSKRLESFRGRMMVKIRVNVMMIKGFRVKMKVAI